MSSATRFVLIILLLPLLFLIRKSSSESNNGFQAILNDESTLRQTRSNEILKYMKLSENPCDDFYEYACGNWAKYHGRHNREAETPAQLLITSINNDLRRLVDEKTRLEDSGLVRRAKDFYKSCLNAERNGVMQQQFLSEFIKNNGGFPAVPGNNNWQMHHHNYDWLEITAQLRKNYAMDILIGLRVDINHNNIHENSIYLTEPSTLIPSAYCSREGTKRFDIREREYEQIEREVADNLKQWLALDGKEAKRVAAEIVTFEFELCMGMQGIDAMMPPLGPASDFQANYTRKNLMQFTSQYHDQLNLNEFMMNSFGKAIYMPVYMTAPEYFQHLIKTVSEFNKTTIANYIMYRALDTLTFPASSQEQPRGRALYCLSVLKRYFPKALSELYVRQHASDSAKSDLEVLYAKVKESFEQSLHSSWLEEGTSRIGSRKLHDIVLNLIEYERTQASNLQIDSINYWHNLATVMGQVQSLEYNRIFESNPPRPRDELEAYETRLAYRTVHKRIDIGWGALQPPFYHAQYSHAMRYASVGHQLATQLATAFNDIHWAVDLLERNSWDPETATEYRNRSKCFERQIGNYLYNNPMGFHNDSQQLRQLIASSAGLNVAFKAYLLWLHFRSPNNDFTLLTKETLPGLNYSNTQLFFITFAQLQCHVDEQQSRTQLAQQPIYSARQRHTLSRYAVNGPLRNSNEFAREFGCKAGTAMNPADKCVIY